MIFPHWAFIDFESVTTPTTALSAIQATNSVTVTTLTESTTTVSSKESTTLATSTTFSTRPMSVLSNDVYPNFLTPSTAISTIQTNDLTDAMTNADPNLISMSSSYKLDDLTETELLSWVLKGFHRPRNLWCSITDASLDLFQTSIHWKLFLVPWYAIHRVSQQLRCPMKRLINWFDFQQGPSFKIFYLNLWKNFKILLVPTRKICENTRYRWVRNFDLGSIWH